MRGAAAGGTRRGNDNAFAKARLSYAGAVESMEFQRVVEKGRQLQARLADLETVAVGGTAAALHCGHRYSLDVDLVTARLRHRFDDTANRLEAWPGWQTNRLNPPVLILGEHDGVELGIRQLRREVPLQTTLVEGLRIPTATEMLRIKAFLLAERRATRDYVDVAALCNQLDWATAVEALGWLNLLYPARTPQSWITRFAEACESGPLDYAAVPLQDYKGLRPPLTDWPFVVERCRAVGRALLKKELEEGLPVRLPEDWTNARLR